MEYSVSLIKQEWIIQERIQALLARKDLLIKDIAVVKNSEHMDQVTIDKISLEIIDIDNQIAAIKEIPLTIQD